MTEQTPQGTQEQSDYIKGIIEALLFVNERPVTIEQMKKALATVSIPEIKSILEDLNAQYVGRHSGIRILEIAGGYQMLSNPDYASYIHDFYKTRHKEKLSKPALETLAIIAYKQPVTKVEVEVIRGVNCDGVIALLLTKELIKPVGRKDVPGRPFFYATTKQFLEYFGLKSLEDLPRLEEFPTLITPVQTQGSPGQSVVQEAQKESVMATNPAGDQPTDHCVNLVNDENNSS